MMREEEAAGKRYRHQRSGPQVGGGACSTSSSGRSRKKKHPLRTAAATLPPPTQNESATQRGYGRLARGCRSSRAARKHGSRRLRQWWRWGRRRAPQRQQHVGGLPDRTSAVHLKNQARLGGLSRGCVHAGGGAEWGGVAHSGPCRKCGPRIFGAPTLGPHSWPVRAQIGRVQGANRVRARRWRGRMGGCGPQWPPPQMRARDYESANFGPPFLASARANRARARRPQGACTQVAGPNGGVWPTVAPAATAGPRLLARQFWAPILGRCARKAGACRAPTAQCTSLLDPPRARFWLKLLVQNLHDPS